MDIQLTYLDQNRVFVKKAWFRFDETIWKNSFDIIEEIKNRCWQVFGYEFAPGLAHAANNYYIVVGPLGFSPIKCILPLPEILEQRQHGDWSGYLK